jgi:hypothetical protein
MRYYVQVRGKGNGYLTRCSTDSWNTAVLNYRCINIGAPYTKRLLEVLEDGKTKVIHRAKGL